MAYYPTAPFQLYAYAQMPIPNHEIYAVYPGGSIGAPHMEGSQYYYEPNSKGYSQSGKQADLHTHTEVARLTYTLIQWLLG